MRRALLLTYYIPPRAAIASVRAQQICSALREYDWDVVPIVPQAPGVAYDGRVRTTGVVDFKAPVRSLFGVRENETTHERFHVEAGSVLVKPDWRGRAIQAAHHAFSYANGRFGWLGPGSRAVEEIVRNERIDAIVSTSPPEGTHFVASRTHGLIPWIADLRDPWTRSDGLGAPPWAREFDRMLEGHVLRSASALSTVSEPIAQRLRERYPGKPVYCIPNAFSRREWWPVPFVQPAHARFVHAGSLYRGLRDPRPFLTALSSLLRSGAVGREEVRVDFYGDAEPWLEALVESFELRGVACLHGRRPRSDIMRALRAASRLLIVAGDGPDDRATYTGKLFECLGARRKIVAIGGPAEETVMDQALAETGAGARFRTAAALESAIVEAVREWREGRTTTIAESAVAGYEVARLGARFAHALESAACVR